MEIWKIFLKFSEKIISTEGFKWKKFYKWLFGKFENLKIIFSNYFFVDEKKLTFFLITLSMSNFLQSPFFASLERFDQYFRTKSSPKGKIMIFSWFSSIFLYFPHLGSQKSFFFSCGIDENWPSNGCISALRWSWAVVRYIDHPGIHVYSLWNRF